jgi:dCMP deaminase
MPFKQREEKAETAKRVERPSLDEYIMWVASLVSERSTCLRRRVGAVLVKDRQILATGYNGAPKGIAHCEETGCLREKLKVPSGQRHEICRGLHAEQNVILQAASFGVSTRGSTLYITSTPCSICAKMIINAGIKEVVAESEYPDRMAIQFLEEAGIRLRKVTEK